MNLYEVSFVNIREHLSEQNKLRAEQSLERDKIFYSFVWKVVLVFSGLFSLELGLLVWLVLRRG